MLNNTDSLLSKGNSAFISGRYDDAINFYNQALIQFPMFEESIRFNILLVEARKNHESVRQTVFKRAMAPYFAPSQIEQKSSSVLILTTDLNPSDIDEACSAAETLDNLASTVVVSCIATLQTSINSIATHARRPIPSIRIESTHAEASLSKLFKNFLPDLVFFCGPEIFIEPMARVTDVKKIPLLIMTPSKITLLEGNASAKKITPIDLEKPFIQTNQNESLYKTNLLSYPPSRESQSSFIKASSQGKDVIIFWKQNDTGLYGRRPDMVAKYLASRDDIRKVLIIDSPLSASSLNAKRYGLPLTQDRDIYTKTYEKIFCQFDSDKLFHHVYISKDKIIYNEAYEKNSQDSFSKYKKYLSDLFIKEGVIAENSTFWFYPRIHFAIDIIETFHPKKVVVDVVDDHRSWPNVSEEEKEKLTKHYEDMLTRASVCIANCQSVANSMKEFNGSILMIPNGCEEQPQLIEPVNDKFYDEIKAFKGKVLGFVGNLESKIDIPLLEKIAKQFTDSLIVLIGSTHANPKVRDLQQYPNIKLTGVVEYKYIHAFVSRFSIGIVPHLRTALTMNMNPLKVFVYAANRIPIVCSDVDNLPEAEFIHIAKSHEEFLEKCNLLLKKDIKNDDHSYARFIETNSWRSRLSHVVDQI